MCAKLLVNDEVEEFVWDERKLEEVLESRDWWRVLAQLRGSSSVKDRPFWPSGNLNEYTVKSGYRLAVNLSLRNEASSSSPYAQALRHRGIDIDNFCRRCGVHEESMEHDLRDCVWAETLRAASPLRLPPISGFCSIPEWFKKIRSCPYREVHSQFACLAWSIWYARNMFVFQHEELSHIECLAIESRAQWSTSACASQQNSKVNRVVYCRAGQMKFSSDAALNEGLGLGMGGGAFTALEGEALAMLESFHLCREHGITDTIFETDNQALYWNLVKREDDLSYLGDTLRAIYELISSFRHIEFSWTPREGTVVADSLCWKPCGIS
ncbi:uncharacterized protein LOC131004675 [Salvia miltiorrhiza]|uniref:uncharacterized protein LOC131004675 n=1 Tax=Salvia miltiorrhiza TaxID=226208 RepID=UPI0025AC07E9|nr:uncharacterized protein LOC131004675 [Salvia miltiorrhiza]